MHVVSMQGVSGAVGPAGQLRVLPEAVGFRFSDSVAQFYQFFPRGTVAGMDRIAAVSPRRDPKTGRNTRPCYCLQLGVGGSVTGWLNGRLCC